MFVYHSFKWGDYHKKDIPYKNALGGFTLGKSTIALHFMEHLSQIMQNCNKT